MKILIADKLAARTVAALEESGAEVELAASLTVDDLPDKVGDANILIVRSTRVTEAAMEAADGLSLIIRAGAGVNTIDVAAASARGIYVTNCPGKNSAAVAELTIGLLVACDRQIVDACVDLRGGQWRKGKYSQAGGLKGRTLGVLGLGMIGRAVVERARGLEMNVIAWSRSLDDELADDLGVERAGSILDVALRSDAVTVHLAAAPETQNVIDEKFLAAMRSGAILINTARGDLVDASALKAAIREKGLRVGLDVFAEEPKGAEGVFNDTELAKMITATPHLGASTSESSEAIADEVLRIVREFRRTGKPPNTVNMCARSPATHALVVRHFNRVGVLAGVLDLLREDGINVEEMENTVFEGAEAACCTLRLDTPPSEKNLAALRAADNILQVTLQKVEV